MANQSQGPPQGFPSQGGEGGPPQGFPSQGGGPPPGFYDAVPFQNHRSTILGISIALMVMCWMAISARLGTRFFITKSMGWDDFFIVFAALMVSTGTIAFCVSTNYGMGQHVYLLSPQDIPNVLICNYIFGAAYNCSAALIKMSLLFQYLRVFERGTWDHRLTKIFLIVLFLWGFAYGFLAWGICLPDPSALWKMTGKGCYGAASSNPNTVFRTITSHAGSNFVFDILVLSLAVRLFFLKDTQTTRMGMLVLLFMGICSCVFAAWRLAEVVRSKAGRSSDLTWDLPAPTILSICEIYIASLCASIPFFWPMLKQQIDKIFVKYDFSVSSELRFQAHDDDALELAPTQSWHSTGISDARSASRSDDNKYLGKEARNYATEFDKNPADPFATEFRTEAAVETGMTGRKNSKKGGFVRFI